MASTSGIEWTTATWNPWMGCKEVSPGCAKCYARREMTKYGKDFHTVMRSKTTFDAPLRWWKRWQEGERDPKKTLAPGSTIFTCSWSDWLILQADPWREEAWGIVRSTPYFYLILTKRIERWAECAPPDWIIGWSNVMLVVSAENQKYADERIPLLLRVPAAYHGVSAEPMLGPIIFQGRGEYDDPGAMVGRNYLRGVSGDKRLDLVITGGESDFESPRYFDLGWARSARDQCRLAGVDYFHKQHGGSKKVNGTWGGRELDGRTHDELPDVSHIFKGFLNAYPD